MGSKMLKSTGTLTSLIKRLIQTVSVQCCGTHSATGPEILRGGIRSLVREVLRVDVQLGIARGDVKLGTYRRHLQASYFFGTQVAHPTCQRTF